MESELGVGSTFSFTIQVKRGIAQQGSLLDAGLDTGDIRLLVVDDDQDTLDCFIDIAGQLGIECDAALDSAGALRYMEENEYSICFIDWDMPDVDGIELSQQIISRWTKKQNIVMISAYDWNDIEDNMKEAGITRFMSKPFLASTVAECVNYCLAETEMTEVAEPFDEIVSFLGKRLLLAEDIEINREIVLAMLEPTMLIIDCAENGAEAVHMFRKNPDRYDVIFMDVQMPVMDGYEATRQIREVEAEGRRRVSGLASSGEVRSRDPDSAEVKEIPIIAMTANVFREDIEKCFEAGMTGHLGKPLDMAAVIEALQAHLDE
jgi:CheY-like chemotaxis protein